MTKDEEVNGFLQGDKRASDAARLALHAREVVPHVGVKAFDAISLRLTFADTVARFSIVEVLVRLKAVGVNQAGELRSLFDLINPILHRCNAALPHGTVRDDQATQPPKREEQEDLRLFFST